MRELLVPYRHSCQDVLTDKHLRPVDLEITQARKTLGSPYQTRTHAVDNASEVKTGLFKPSVQRSNRGSLTAVAIEFWLKVGRVNL